MGIAKFDEILKLEIAAVSVFYFEKNRNRLHEYSLMRKKTDKTIIKKCNSVKFRKQRNFVTCISPDYVFHESPKEFWKNNHF